MQGKMLEKLYFLGIVSEEMKHIEKSDLFCINLLFYKAKSKISQAHNLALMLENLHQVYKYSDSL